MGQVSLLTREGEVEIAKRIESGEHAQLYSIVGSAFGLRTILQKIDGLKTDLTAIGPGEQRNRAGLQFLYEADQVGGMRVDREIGPIVIPRAFAVVALIVGENAVVPCHDMSHFSPDA